ncbi:hypothetical protein NEOC84_000882|nr:hypothetical protein [Neochlamydia sp. AcF84]
MSSRKKLKIITLFFYINVSGRGVGPALEAILRASAKPKMLANSCFFYLLHFLIYIISLLSGA